MKRQRRLLYRQSTEKSQFNDSRLLMIARREAIQRLVDGKHAHVNGPMRLQRLAECDSQAPLPLFREPCARMVNQYLTHQSGRKRNEVTVTLYIHGRPIRQPKVRFVDQCRSLQRMVCTFVTEVLARELSQLLVDQRQNDLQSLVVASPPPRKQIIGRRVIQGIIRRMEFRFS